MIAQRQQEQEEPEENIGDNLFEGLSFPDVPTAPVSVPSIVTQNTTVRKPDILQRPEFKPVVTEAAPLQPTVSAVAGKKKGNLSALYSPEVDHSTV